MVLLLAACEGESTTRDHQDASPPTIAISVAGKKGNPGGIDEAPFGSTTELTPSGAEILVTANDDGGVSAVELWMTETAQCPGVNQGPSLAGAPTATAKGNLTDTQAPSQLLVTTRLDPANRRPNCTYLFDVWGEADNAADAPVHAKSPTVRFTLKA